MIKKMKIYTLSEQPTLIELQHLQESIQYYAHRH
nr:MAG TPA: hypothetical protein [Crassvirales sp.]